MKKLNIFLISLCTLGLLAACSDDDKVTIAPDENIVPPVLAASIDNDLVFTEQTSMIDPVGTLQWDPANYGYNAAVKYSVMVDVEGGDFSKAVEMTTSNATKVEVTAKMLNEAALKFVSKSEPVKLQMRLKAAISSIDFDVRPDKSVTSNIVAISLTPYVPVVALPEKMFLMGSMAGSKNAAGEVWKVWQAMVPVTDTPGMFWSMQYFADGDQMKFNQVADWTDTAVGYSVGLVPDASATLVGGIKTDNDKNIVIGKAGWYIVVVTAKIKGASLAYSLEFAAPNVYVTGEDLVGKDNWGKTSPEYLFTAPADAAGSFEYTLTNGKSGDLRIFAQVPGADWWKTELVPFSGKIEYRENRGELGNSTNNMKTNLASGQKVTLNFLKGEGAVN